MREFVGESKRVWRYEPTEFLGSPGGFGSVHPGLSETDTPIAVKVIKPHLTDGSKIDTRLRQREIEIAHKLQGASPRHLIQALDVGQDQETLLLVMPRAEGALDVPAGGFSEAEGLRIIRDIAEGLHELHQLGVIHRDLKPRNILRHEGEWKLADFGIAHDSDVGTQDPTFVGAGTYPYMAPELWELRSASVKSDLYAAGCVFFELLTGRLAFPGPEHRRQHLELPPPSILGGNPVIRDMVSRLLNKNPAERPQDARAVLDRLSRVTLSLSDAQRALQSLAASAAEDRSTLATQMAVEQARENARKDLLVQAVSDLRDIWEDGFLLIEQALAGAIHEQRGSEFHIHTADVRLELKTWAPWPPQLPKDTLVLAGEARISNWRNPGVNRPCNIVYEEIDGRNCWIEYAFEAGAVIQHYGYGPRDRAHGLDPNVFQDREHRAAMLAPIMHVWTLRKTVFSPERIMSLFQEAMALPPARS